MLTDYKELNSRIPQPDQEAMSQAKQRWDSIAKPLNGLGELEHMIIRIAGLTGTDQVQLDQKAVLVLCADNGIVAEGVTQSDSSVTAIMAGQIAAGHSSVCRMAACAKAKVYAIDMGMEKTLPDVPGCHIADKTANFAKGPAMTALQADRAIRYGIDLVRRCKEEGYRILATGEMGIGNTSTSCAIASVLLHLPVEELTGRGAGLSDEGLARKIRAIKKGIEVNRPDPSDAFDVLMKLGGFDIAGIVGLYLGGALYRIPIVIDGLISSVAALIAYRLCPAASCAMLASHASAEPASLAILKELGVKPVLYADMKLGEGTGAVCIFPILDMALSVYNTSAAFTSVGVEQYRDYSRK